MQCVDINWFKPLSALWVLTTLRYRGVTVALSIPKQCPNLASGFSGSSLETDEPTGYDLVRTDLNTFPSSFVGIDCDALLLDSSQRGARHLSTFPYRLNHAAMVVYGIMKHSFVAIAYVGSCLVCRTSWITFVFFRVVLHCHYTHGVGLGLLG